MSRNFRSLASAGLLALAACGGAGGIYGGGTDNPPPPPPAGTVSATPNLVFTPSPLTINAGDEVTFAFGATGHNVTFDNRTQTTPADIPGINSSKSVKRPFTTAGTYNYHCTIHPGMAGSIVVR
jgi:plastocyanin